MKKPSQQDSMPASSPPCLVEFRVTNQERFQILAHAFEILKQEKLKYLQVTFEQAAEEQENEGDEQAFSNIHEKILHDLMETFFDLLDERALSHFWWPSKQESQNYWQRWAATPEQQRFTDPTMRIPWDFESMIDCLLNGEYELTACRLLARDMGVLEFSPFSFPYGGTGCMKAFIEAFDCPIIGEDNGTGYVSYLKE
jgi:hypothetical protein